VKGKSGKRKTWESSSWKPSVSTPANDKGFRQWKKELKKMVNDDWNYGDHIYGTDYKTMLSGLKRLAPDESPEEVMYGHGYEAGLTPDEFMRQTLKESLKASKDWRLKRMRSSGKKKSRKFYIGDPAYFDGAGGKYKKVKKHQTVNTRGDGSFYGGKLGVDSGQLAVIEYTGSFPRKFDKLKAGKGYLLKSGSKVPKIMLEGPKNRSVVKIISVTSAR